MITSVQYIIAVSIFIAAPAPDTRQDLSSGHPVKSPTQAELVRMFEEKKKQADGRKAVSSKSMHKLDKCMNFAILKPTC